MTDKGGAGTSLDRASTSLDRPPTEEAKGSTILVKGGSAGKVLCFVLLCFVLAPLGCALISTVFGGILALVES